jgi:glutamate synthase domain-containing protein 1
MCRIGAIKSKKYIHPSKILKLMRSQQKGHDNSGFAFVMQDLGGIFENYKELPILSMACTDEGMKFAEDMLHKIGFTRVFQYNMEVYPQEGLEIQTMPNYVFEVFQYPKNMKYASREEKENLLLDARLELRKHLELNEEGYVYSFWEDVISLKEIGNPNDIGKYFNLWSEKVDLRAKIITAQCRQNTNYDIVRYAAHPFFLQGYTTLTNGENTFYEKNKLAQEKLYHGYIGFESDSQCFLYTLHYVNKILKWPIKYYKHVLTPLPYSEMEKRKDKNVLERIRTSLANLEINGPNTTIAVLPDGTMLNVVDSKKLRPTVVCKDEDMVIITSEVCGANEILPNRKIEEDIYTNERETVVVDNDLNIVRIAQ